VACSSGTATWAATTPAASASEATSRSSSSIPRRACRPRRASTPTSRSWRPPPAPTPPSPAPTKPRATLVEKPLAGTLADARALAALPGLCVGHIERFNPVLEAVAHVRPRFVEAQRLSAWPAPDRPGARGTDADVLADLMLHDLDLALGFLPGDVTDVRAVGAGVLSGHPDIAKARLEIGGGVADLTASRVSRRAVRSLRLVEDGLYWSVDLLARTVTRVRWGAGALDGERVEVADGDALMREHAAFLDTVRSGGPMPVSGAEALRVLEVVEDVRRALNGGAPTP
jgi:predicted dehydrogenase